MTQKISKIISKTIMRKVTLQHDNESINGKIKEVKKEKSTRFALTDVHTFLSDLEKSQRNDMVQALRQSGDYELSSSYKHLKIDPDVWFRLPEHSRQNRISTFFKTPPVRTTEEKMNINNLINLRAIEAEVKKKKIIKTMNAT